MHEVTLMAAGKDHAKPAPRRRSTRLWRLVHHHVEAVLAAQELSTVERPAVDESSFRRGQDYVSVFADID